jgi:tRNA nucleotidyltransferase/poly(A) polymerase
MRQRVIHDPVACDVAQGLINAGFAAYVAGGAARDMVMGQSPADYDIVTNAVIEDIERLFPDRTVRESGSVFRVALVSGVEVSTFRSKSSYDPACKQPAPGGSIEEDLALRDLTVNSMAVNAKTGELIDPFGGKKDLNNRVIRFTGDPAERMAEDPCRAVRACRFLALLSGSFAPETLAALKVHAPGAVMRTKAERLRLEILKAMRIRKASMFFRALFEIGALRLLLPSLADAAGHDGGPNHADTIFDHCMLAGDSIPTRCPSLKLAAYLHDAGKPSAAGYVGGRLKFIGHAKLGESLLARELARLYFSRRDMRKLLSLVRHHMNDLTPSSTPRAVRRLHARLASDGVSYMSFLRLRVADRAANRAKKPYSLTQIKKLISILEQEAFPKAHGPAFTVCDLAVSGNDVMRELGIMPGAAVGRVLEGLLEQVIEDPELNTRETLTRLMREID